MQAARNHVMSLLQCFAVCCSELQCVTGVTRRSLCTVLQCVGVAVCCSVLKRQMQAARNHMKRVWQRVAVYCSVLQELCTGLLTVYCSVLQCVAVCCSVLQCLAVSYSVLQCLAAYYSVLQYVVAADAGGTQLLDECAAVCCSVLQCDAVCYSVLTVADTDCVQSRDQYVAVQGSLLKSVAVSAAVVDAALWFVAVC